jgi:hypothetical protein
MPFISEIWANKLFPLTNLSFVFIMLCRSQQA